MGAGGAFFSVYTCLVNGSAMYQRAHQTNVRRTHSRSTQTRSEAIPDRVKFIIRTHHTTTLSLPIPLSHSHSLFSVYTCLVNGSVMHQRAHQATSGARTRAARRRAQKPFRIESSSSSEHTTPQLSRYHSHSLSSASIHVSSTEARCTSAHTRQRPAHALAQHANALRSHSG